MVRLSSKSCTAMRAKVAGPCVLRGSERHAKACLEQSEQVAVGADLVEARHVELPCAQEIEQLRGRLAIRAHHHPLLLQLVERNALALRESVHAS